LNVERYNTFKKTIGDSRTQIAKNLKRLNKKFLRKFHVSKLPKRLGTQLGDVPWTFYTVEGSLKTETAGKGIVIIRPPRWAHQR